MLAGDVVTSATTLNEFWTSFDEIPASVNGTEAYVPADEFEVIGLDEVALRAELDNAPLEFTPEAATPLIVELPSPSGELERFAVVESPIIHPELAARYDHIKTFRGIGLDNTAANLRFDLTDHGFHAQVIAPGQTYYVDPVYHLETTAYASYFRADLAQSARPEFSDVVIDPATLEATEGQLELQDDGSLVHIHDDGTSHVVDPGTIEVLGSSIETGELTEEAGGGCPFCGSSEGCICPATGDVADENNPADAQLHGLEDSQGDSSGDPQIQLIPRTGDELRTYRTAVATTGEYTSFFGGTVSNGLSAVVTAMNRVTGVYETELSIRFELVPNNDSIIYTNANSDPYTNNNAFSMLSQNQSNLTSVIGSANYDHGHVFGSGATGGVASLGSVGINSRKAQGATGINPPRNDPFWIDFVAHEMGHQFGANHTFNGDSGSCSGGNRSGSDAFEPGSGTTIMAYAGICGNDNLQNNSDPFFHFNSLDEIINVVESRRNSTGEFTSSGNSIPTAEAGSNFSIPTGTPFELTGSGSDADGDTITYSWEERDLGPQRDVNASDNGSSPIFRSWEPTTNPTRTFPRITSLVNNTTVRGEQLPTVARNMRFRLTVRDNNLAAGGVATDNMTVSVVDTGSPFRVTSPNNSSVEWSGGSMETVTWDVAGTTANGINVSTVNILLSTDGGLTYPIVVASDVANDGSEMIQVPNVLTDDARIRVEANGNIFFDISNSDFSIIERTDFVDPTAIATASDITTEGGAVQQVSVTYTDDNAIVSSTLGSGDVEVIAPDGSSLFAFLVTLPPPIDLPVVSATYQISAPGGTWDAADVGTYDIRMVSGEVVDTGGNVVASGSIGSFEVDFGMMAVDGDFDNDGDLDCNDVDGLVAEINSGNHNADFDLTGDGLVNADDLNDWVLNEKGTLIGDANLDFQVDISDFNLWNANKFQSGTGWCGADFDGNGGTDVSDFNLWNVNKFTSATPPSPVAVPVTTREATTATDIEIEFESQPQQVALDPAPLLPARQANRTLIVNESHDRRDWETAVDRVLLDIEL